MKCCRCKNECDLINNNDPLCYACALEEGLDDAVAQAKALPRFSADVIDKLNAVLAGHAGEYIGHVLQAAVKKASEIAEIPHHSVVVIRRMHYVFFFLIDEDDRHFCDVEIHRELSEPGHDFVWTELEES